MQVASCAHKWLHITILLSRLSNYSLLRTHLLIAIQKLWTQHALIDHIYISEQMQRFCRQSMSTWSPKYTRLFTIMEATGKTVSRNCKAAPECSYWTICGGRSGRVLPGGAVRLLEGNPSGGGRAVPAGANSGRGADSAGGPPGPPAARAEPWPHALPLRHPHRQPGVLGGRWGAGHVGPAPHWSALHLIRSLHSLLGLIT